MNININFYDIIRYILLGAILVVIAIISLHFRFDPDFTNNGITAILFTGIDAFNIAFKENIWNKFQDYNATIYIAILSICFIIGVTAQAFRKYVAKSRMGEWLVDLMANRCYLVSLFRPFLGCICYSCEQYCKIISNKRDNPEHAYPNWIYISKRPHLLLNVLAEYVDNHSKYGSDRITKSLNEFSVTLMFFLIPIATIFALIGICKFNLSINIQATKFSIIFILVIHLGLALLSNALAKNYIKHIGNQCNALEHNDKNLHQIYNLYGAPTAFILVRSHESDASYLQNALKSIAEQTYYNIRIIVLEDRPSEQIEESKIETEIKRFIDERERQNDTRRYRDIISYCNKDCGGAAGSAFHIREAFLQIADENDIAIFLDGDDRFKRPDAVEDIVAQMGRTKAQICVTSFETVEKTDNNICNNGGKSHLDQVRKFKKRRSIFNKNEFCYLSSIGWTKSYKYEQLKKYQELIKTRKDDYCNLKFYEDFPDILALLIDQPVITGLNEPTHAYYKREGSITGTPSIEAFKTQRAGFLALLWELAISHDNNNVAYLTNKAKGYVAQFIIIKIFQIENILAKYRNDYINYQKKNLRKQYIYKPYNQDTYFSFFIECFDDKLKNRKNWVDLLENTYHITPKPRNDIKHFIIQIGETEIKKNDLLDIGALKEEIKAINRAKTILSEGAYYPKKRKEGTYYNKLKLFCDNIEKSKKSQLSKLNKN